MIIWHNPRCSKSRQTLALLEEKGHTPTVRRYLDDAPTAEEIKDVLSKLGLRPMQIVRTKEKEYKAQAADAATDEGVIAMLASTPKLIERPIVINGDKAAIGRPPEAVLVIL